MVEYEWDCEKVDREEGDIVDHFFGESLEEVLGWVEADDDQHEYRIVLERVCAMTRPKYRSDFTVRRRRCGQHEQRGESNA
jgi:hypothetical protein